MFRLTDYEDVLDTEGSRLDTAIKLINLSRTIAVDISNHARDDFDIVYKGGSTRFATLKNGADIASESWPNHRTKPIRSKLHVHTDKNLLTADIKQWIRGVIRIRYSFNGRSIIIDQISRGDFDDLPGWGIEAEVLTYKIDPMVMDGDVDPVARIQVICRFNYIQGIFFDTEEAIDEQHITIDSRGRVWQKWHRWEKRREPTSSY